MGEVLLYSRRARCKALRRLDHSTASTAVESQIDGEEHSQSQIDGEEHYGKGSRDPGYTRLRLHAHAAPSELIWNGIV